MRYKKTFFPKLTSFMAIWSSKYICRFNSLIDHAIMLFSLSILTYKETETDFFLSATWLPHCPTGANPMLITKFDTYLT